MKRGVTLFILLVLAQLASIAAPARVMWWIFSNQDQAFEVIKGYDLLGNPVINGKAGEYISTHANRARSEDKTWGCVLCKLLDSIQPNHCKDSPEGTK